MSDDKPFDPYAWRGDAKRYREKKNKYFTRKVYIKPTAEKEIKQHQENAKAIKEEQKKCKCGSTDTYVIDIFVSHIFERICFKCRTVYVSNPKEYGDKIVSSPERYLRKRKEQLNIKDED